MLFPPFYTLIRGPLVVTGLVCRCIHWQDKHKPKKTCTKLHR